jgi:hypothetical protein
MPRIALRDVGVRLATVPVDTAGYLRLIRSILATLLHPQSEGGRHIRTAAVAQLHRPTSVDIRTSLSRMRQTAAANFPDVQIGRRNAAIASELSITRRQRSKRRTMKRSKAVSNTGSARISSASTMPSLMAMLASEARCGVVAWAAAPINTTYAALAACGHQEHGILHHNNNRVAHIRRGPRHPPAPSRPLLRR